jgi:catechol 2,3-dioxygenase-like lactoylglutathione lyase family enzyme
MKQISRYILVVILSSLYGRAISQVQKVEAISITVAEMDRSIKFYSEVLGFKKVSDEEVWGEEYEKLLNLFGLRMRVVRMKLGEEIIELTDYLTSGGRSIPEDARSNDLTFQHIAIVVSNMEAAYNHLRKYMVMHVSTAPQTIPVSNTAAAGIKAFYFHDPDMHNLELIYFPKGKGNPKWQCRNKHLFLGIDHTAISVSNTDSSLLFYESLLGIMRKGESWNMGMEQAHLNFVQAANLHITGLRAPDGPGIEFLEYIHPGPGKPYPSDSRTDDIWHWHTTLLVDNAMRLYEQLRATEYRFVSEKLIQLRDKNGRVGNAFILRDRDGHAILIKDNLEAEQHLTQKN